MINIRGKFIQSIDGIWHNLRYIRSFYIGGDKEVGYRICISYEPENKSSMGLGYMNIGETHKTLVEAQTQLNAVLSSIDYGEG